jgi:hypothetical protein
MSNIETYYNAGLNQSRLMLGMNTPSGLHLAWGAAFALRAREIHHDPEELYNAWRALMDALPADTSLHELLPAMGKYLRQSLNDLKSVPTDAGTLHCAISSAGRQFDEIGLEFALRKSQQLVAMAEQLSVLTGSRTLVDEASRVAHNALQARALANYGWMTACPASLEADVRYRPYRQSALKRPTALQSGFDPKSRMPRWFQARFRDLPAWSNNQVIDLRRPPYRSWRQGIAPCPGSNDLEFRPDLSLYLDNALQDCRTELVPIAIREPVRGGAGEVLYDANGSLVVVSRLWVSYLLHQHPQGILMAGSPDEPVAVVSGEQMVAMVCPVAPISYAGEALTPTEVRRRTCLENSSNLGD